MPASGTQSIDRAAELLTLVVHSEEPRSFTELADRTGLARSTTSRVLQALERHDLLHRDGDGCFVPGALFASYASRVEPYDALVRSAEPILAEIGEQTKETVNLAVVRGRQVVHVAQVDSGFLLGTTNWVGVEVPAHCSALGKVMYAHGLLELPGSRLPALTPDTVTDPDVLRGQLGRVRRIGYATTMGELEEGLDAIAAPVCDPDGVVVAAIGVSGPSFRLTERRNEFGQLLIHESTRLTRTLGSRVRRESA